MGKSTSINLRSLVIFQREKGKSLREIGEEFKIAKSTVQKICERYYREDRIEDINSNKGPRKITSSDEKFILRAIRNNPMLTAIEIQKALVEFSGTIVNPITIRRVLKKNKILNRIARRKPLISEINRKKRLKFAKTHRNNGVEFWKNVLFIDESRFSLFRNDKHQVKVWRKANQGYLLKNISSTVKHGGLGVMLWGAMGYNGTGNMQIINGTMDQFVYLNILKRNVHESARKLGIEHTFNFYQDNDPKHKAWINRIRLLYHCPKVIETPPQSPDLLNLSIVEPFGSKTTEKSQNKDSISTRTSN